METRTREVRMTKAKGGGSQRKGWKKTERKEEKEAKEKNNRSKKGSRGIGNLG